MVTIGGGGGGGSGGGGGGVLSITRIESVYYPHYSYLIK